MEGYEEIFEKRGKSYHEAMELYPEARKEEFQVARRHLKLSSGSVIVDLPAGGGYLKNYLPEDIEYLAYDFSGEFDDAHSGVKKCKESMIDLPDQTVDEVVTLAALHHILDREGFYSEMFRILKPEGRFVIGDVMKGSKVDPFLNVFLDQWNSMGHNGIFIDPEKDIPEIVRAGFQVTFETEIFNWVFDTMEDGQQFFRKLFFLDKNPSTKELQNALDKLGTQHIGNAFLVGWSLGFLVGTKV